MNRAQPWGLRTKIHALIDALGNPAEFYLTPSQASDLEGADVLPADTPRADRDCG